MFCTLNVRSFPQKMIPDHGRKGCSDEGGREGQESQVHI
jgi:hypothetical protein